MQSAVAPENGITLTLQFLSSLVISHPFKCFTILSPRIIRCFWDFSSELYCVLDFSLLFSAFSMRFPLFFSFLVSSTSGSSFFSVFFLVSSSCLPVSPSFSFLSLSSPFIGFSLTCFVLAETVSTF